MTKNNDCTSLNLVLIYFNAWSNKHFEDAANCLAEDITFEMPINSYDSKQSFMEAVKFTGSAASSVRLLAKFGNEDEALLVYDMELAPVGNLRVAEYFAIKDGRINMIRHIHDTAQLRDPGYS